MPLYLGSGQRLHLKVNLYNSGGLFGRNLGGEIGSIIDLSSFYAFYVDLFGPIRHPIPDEGFVEYRCLYLKNEEPNLTVPIEIFGDCDNDVCRSHTELAVGLGVSPVNGVEPSIPNPYTAPVGVNFVVATDSNPLIVEPLYPSEHKAIWLRRVVFPSCPFVRFSVAFAFRYVKPFL